jgi:hypothetical protein
LELLQVPRVRARVWHRKLWHVRLRTRNDDKVFDDESKSTQRCRLPQRSRVKNGCIFDTGRAADVARTRTRTNTNPYGTKANAAG